jgi:hypothetical protein
MRNDDLAADPEHELARYFAKYEPALAKLGQQLRTKLRKRLPGLSEIVYVYENQGALVVSYSPTDKGYEAVCSLALGPSGAKLCFARGPALSKADPHKLLQGRGKLVRHVELQTAADFDRPELQALLAAALKLANLRPLAGAKSALILKADSQRQRAKAAKRPIAAKRAPRKARG